MLDLKFVRENPEIVRKAIRDKGEDSSLPYLQQFSLVDEKRRSLLHEAEELKHRRNLVSEEIARMKKDGKDASVVIAEMRRVSQQIKELDQQIREADNRLQEILLNLPNIPDSSVPIGSSEEENVPVRYVGKKEFAFTPSRTGICG